MSEKKILQTAFEQYKLDNASAHLLGNLWNRVYRVETAEKSYSLRLCPVVMQNKQGIEDELKWLEFVVNQQQIQVPRPVRNKHGNLVTTIPTPKGERLCCLFEWIDGESLKNDLRLDVMGQMGHAVASLHNISRDFGSPMEHKDFRSNYRYDSSLAASHREWIKEHEQEIGRKRVKLLISAVDLLVGELIRVGEVGKDYGFIHADLHLGNFLIKENVLSVIDFDQLGRGHFLYDLAVLRVELDIELSNSSVIWGRFIEGYQQVADLPFTKESELQPFIVAVNLAFLDWVYNSRNPEVKKQMADRLPLSYSAITEWLQSYGKL